MDVSISGVVFPTSCGSRLYNRPWYASVNNKLSSQVTKVGTSNSLASLNYQLSFWYLNATKIRDLPLMTVSLSLTPPCLQPPCILIRAKSTFPFQAEIQCSPAFILRWHSIKDKFFLCVCVLHLPEKLERVKAWELGEEEGHPRKTFFHLLLCLCVCVCFLSFLTSLWKPDVKAWHSWLSKAPLSASGNPD